MLPFFSRRSRTTRTKTRGRSASNAGRASYRPRLEILEDRTVPSTLSQTQLLQNYGQVPLSFEINQGQSDPQVNFLSHGNGYGLFLTPAEAVLSLQKPSSGANTWGTQTGGFGSLVIPPLGGPLSPPQGGTTSLDASPTDVLQMQLVGANAASPAVGLNPLSRRQQLLHRQ